jgi:hypothetical protein
MQLPPDIPGCSYTASQEADAYRELAAKLAPSRERNELLEKAREADAVSWNTGRGGSKEQNELFRRAEAAIAVSRRLVAQIAKCQDDILQWIRRMRSRARFLPRSPKIMSPQDFPERHRVYEPFPSGNGED